MYVGSAESEDYDQILDTVVVGPIIAGRHMFVFEVLLVISFLSFILFVKCHNLQTAFALLNFRPNIPV